MKNKILKIFNKVASDIYGMFCGADGRLSLRSVLASLFTAVLLHICYLVTWYEKPVHVVIVYTLATMILILLGLVTVQNIISILKFKTGRKEDNE